MRRWSLAIAVLVLAAGCPYDGRSLDDAPPAVPDGPRIIDGPPGEIDAVPVIDARPPGAQVAARPCPAAPTGCLACSCGTPSCYYACPPREWGGAQEHCQSAGVGCLATIGDDAENACINLNTA